MSGNCWSRRAVAALVVAAIMAPGAGAGAAVDGTRHLTGFSGLTAVTVTSTFDSTNSMVNRPLTDGQPAYDYSTHLILEPSPRLYRLYSGGRWRVSANGPLWDGDHVLQHDSATGAAGSWTMPHMPARAEFLKGEEEGAAGAWYSRNCLEPEVVRVGATYYMYTQVEVPPGSAVDQTTVPATTPADRIQLHTSTDGLTWTRWSTTRGVVVNMPAPQSTALHHQEVVYVPWDATARPWWLYVAMNEGGPFTGYWRLRSNDPTTYDFATREPAGLAQLGNQIGYMKDAPGGPVFVRITFTDDGSGRAVPSLQFSRDGLAWTVGDEGPFLLHGSTDTASNRNCYFLGLSTINGTGELEKTDATGRNYQALFAATTSNSPVAPDIFASEIGGGRLTLSLEVPASAGSWDNLE